MAKIRRNGPCPCRSGSKAKRCCYAIDRTEDVHFLPGELYKAVVDDLRGADDVELRPLFDELLYLPEVDSSLQVRLGILTPEMDRAVAALQDNDGDEFDHVLGQVVPSVDTVDRRVELAQAVIALRDQ